MVNSVAVGIGLLILLARYEGIVSDLQVSRVTVTANAVKNTIESQLALGLQLQDAHDVASVVARAAKRDADLEAILVHDAEGRVLFANREALLAGATPQQAISLLRGYASGNRLASWRDGSAGFVAVPLISSFGVPAGGLVLKFSRTTPVQALERATEQLAGRALAVLVGGIVVLGAAAYLAFRPLTRLAQEAARGLEAMTHDGSPISLPSSGWLARELQSFEQDARLALVEIKEAESRLEKASSP